MESGRNPKQQVRSDFNGVNLIQNLMPSAGIEMVSDIPQTCPAIAIDKNLNTFETLTDRVIASREQING